MHEFRKQTGRAPRRAVDGFLHAPLRPATGQPPRLAVPARPQSSGLRPGPRRVSEFKRPDGLHLIQPAAADVIRSPKPAQPKSGAGGGATTAAQPVQGSLLHMTLPGASAVPAKESKRFFRKAKKDRARKLTKWGKVRRLSFRTGLVFACLLLVVGGFLGIKTMTSLHKVLKGGGTAAALQAKVTPQLLKGEGDGRVNFLLLGRGGDGHDGPDLTDTLLVASIDPVNHTAALVSIPRDLWVTVSGYGQMKINAVYANAKYHALNLNPKDEAKAEAAGISLVEQEVTDVLGIPINYHVLVDFQAFKQAVDAVGGIDVNVAEDLVDPTMAWENHNNAVLAKKGLDHMDGTQALLYVRSRHSTARGDFDRTERQRLLLEALGQKVLSAGTYTNPLKISQLLSALGDHVTTDMGVNDALRLMTIAKGIPGGGIQSVGLADPPNNFVVTDAAGSASVVRPAAGFDDYSNIQNYIRNTLKDPYLAKENAAVEVLNGTATAGLAGTTGDTLKSYGYNVVKVDSTPTAGYAKTVIVDLSGGKDPFTKNYLEKRFGVTAVTKLPDAAIQATGAQFVVILGQDATTNSQN